MAYLKPPWFVRKIGNKIAQAFGAGGSSTLTVPGRRTGEPKTVPVIVVDVDGTRYLVSTRGESEWVRNIRAAGGGELKRKGTTERFSATEVPPDERPPILDAYRARAGRTVKSYFEKLPDPADHPTFRVTPG
jgi:deazaflavin-dependent oxidoreductase (nitroreductase family)